MNVLKTGKMALFEQLLFSGNTDHCVIHDVINVEPKFTIKCHFT